MYTMLLVKLQSIGIKAAQLAYSIYMECTD